MMASMIQNIVRALFFGSMSTQDGLAAKAERASTSTDLKEAVKHSALKVAAGACFKTVLISAQQVALITS